MYTVLGLFARQPVFEEVQVRKVVFAWHSTNKIIPEYSMTVCSVHECVRKGKIIYKVNNLCFLYRS